MHTFETPGPTTIVVRTGAGHVTVAAGDTDTTTVELTALNSAGEEAIAQATVEQSRHTVVVHLPKHRSGLLRQGPSVGIDIVCPHGVALDLKSDSADLRATGQFQEASCATGSGDIDLETVTGAAKLRTGSGTITAGEVGQALSVSSGSGDINVEASRGSGSVKVGSGDISIGELDGQTVTKTGSGDVEVGRLGGSLVTKTGSGSLTVRTREHRLGPRRRRQRRHHHRRGAGHRRLARRVHRQRPREPGARRVRGPDQRPEPDRDHRPHRERQPPHPPRLTTQGGTR